MAFKGLSDRFEARMNELYGHGSTADGGPIGRNAEPYIEVKPTDNDREETLHDTRTLPIGSVKRDLKRLGKFTVSDRGLIFMGKQELLQSGNSFAETRIINPLFVLGNVTPYIHMDRPLSKASLYTFGDSDTISPASMDSNIGHAGRMQKETKAAAISKVTGASGMSGLLSLLPNTVTQLINGVKSIRNGGTTDVNDRPELDMNGELYSVLLWKGLQKQKNPQDYFSSALNNLRTGNLSGAVRNVSQGISRVENIAKNPLDFLEGKVSVTGAPTKEERNQPWNTAYNGRRYFITSVNSADRYLKNSVNEDGGVFIPNSFKLPWALPGVKDALPSPSALKNLQNTVSNNVKSATQKVQDSVRKTTQAADVGIGILPGGTLPVNLNELVNQATVQENPMAENNMLLGNLSLQSRYADEDHLTFVHAQLKAQKDSQFAYWKEQNTVKQTIGGGLKPGTEVEFNPMSRNKQTMGYRDLMNSTGVVSAGTSAAAIQDAKKNADFVNVLFYDVINKKSIPFRAFISSINQNTSTEIADTTYIGRTDRNIVYVKAVRELSFQLRLQAFHPNELESVWEKAEYLNSLCFPAMYEQGFMVPPLVKLTIGNLYREQPGVIRSLSYTVEDGTSWETADGLNQVPHGLLINVQFSIIEKTVQSSRTSANGKLFGFVPKPITSPQK